MDQTEENYLDNFEIKRIIKERSPISNLEYSISGEIFSFTTNDSLKICSSNGELKNIIAVELEGMKYFQNNTILLYKGNTIYYHSVFDNTFQAKFQAEDKVMKLTVNSLKDLFMTTGTCTSQIYDIRVKDSIKKIQTKHKKSAIGNMGYAVADNNYIWIFDMRNDRGPVDIREITPGFYRDINYSPDSSLIALEGNTEIHFLDEFGDQRSRIAINNYYVGDLERDSNTFVYATSNTLVAHRINAKQRIGQIPTPAICDFTALKTNPMSSRFLLSSSDNCIYMGYQKEWR